jgi:hypothetical protein
LIGGLNGVGSERELRREGCAADPESMVFALWLKKIAGNDTKAARARHTQMTRENGKVKRKPGRVQL